MELNELYAEFKGKFDRAQESIDRAEELNKKLDWALTAANEALNTAEEITIPGLVAANKTFQAAWDAESSLITMRATLGQAATRGEQE